MSRLSCRDNDVGVTLDDEPTESVACITGSDVGLTCLDVDIRCANCIQVADVDCTSDGVVALFCLDVGIRCIDCVQIADIGRLCGSAVEV